MGFRGELKSAESLLNSAVQLNTVGSFNWFTFKAYLNYIFLNIGRCSSRCSGSVLTLCGVNTRMCSVEMWKMWKSIVHWSGVGQGKEFNSEGTILSKQEAPGSISLHFQWECCCLMLLSGGSILKSSCQNLGLLWLQRTILQTLLLWLLILICRD